MRISTEYILQMQNETTMQAGLIFASSVCVMIIAAVVLWNELKR